MRDVVLERKLLRSRLNRDYYERNRSRIAAKMLARATQNRRDAIRDLGGKCVKCSSDNKLEFDHIDRSTKINHRIWTWGAVKRAAEIAKCQLLCQPCHIDKSTSEQVAHWATRGE